MKISEFLDKIVLPETFDPDLTRKKKDIFRSVCLDMLTRTIGMFEYENLPETLSARSMEIEMQTNGFCCITEVSEPLNGKPGLYCFRTASPSGQLNADRLPTRVVVDDPWLNFNKELVIDEDCIVIANDVLWRGLGSNFSLYGGQLTDGETTMRLQLYNARINKILTATDDKVIESAKALLLSIEDGKWGVIGDEVELMGMMKALSSVDFTSPHAGSIKDSMEVVQYYRAQWFISLGLNDNFNMKREALNGTETESNANTLFALPLMMLEYRKKGIEKLNEKYGTNVSVKFGSVWETAYKNYLMSLKVQEKEAGKPSEEPKGEEHEEEGDKTDE